MTPIIEINHRTPPFVSTWEENDRFLLNGFSVEYRFPLSDFVILLPWKKKQTNKQTNTKKNKTKLDSKKFEVKVKVHYGLQEKHPVVWPSACRKRNFNTQFYWPWDAHSRAVYFFTPWINGEHLSQMRFPRRLPNRDTEYKTIYKRMWQLYVVSLLIQ